MMLLTLPCKGLHPAGPVARRAVRLAEILEQMNQVKFIPMRFLKLEGPYSLLIFRRHK